MSQALGISATLLQIAEPLYWFDLPAEHVPSVKRSFEAGRDEVLL